MRSYKLKEPPKVDRTAYYFFVTVLCAFLVYIMLIRPMTLPANQMPFIFEYDPKTMQVTDSAKQKRTYFIMTATPMVVAPLLVWLGVRNTSKEERYRNVMYANRNYLLHAEYMSIVEKFKTTVFKTNADEVFHEFTQTIKKHSGKDMRVEEYGLNKDYAENLQRA